MRLLLIRHGESVDNVAGLYAGSRDSSLTNHGVLQAKRLGAHIASRQTAIGPICHVFASNLQRAYQTADAIAEACRSTNDDSTSSLPSGVIRVEELREKDFGLSEGKKFGAKDSDDGSETAESMCIRINRFLDHSLSPTIDQLAAENATVVVVAHGIILNVLLKALLLRYPSKSSIQRLTAERTGSDYLAPWSNTGVLQARLEVSDSISRDLASSKIIHMIVESTNNVDHLQGLKKTRGGIGSASYDSRQRTMESFFTSASRKRKLDEDENNQ
ncbi:phosphoglycerate mutase-like protein [Xylaria bambusicola]|uniref:phosphoglycerate mutase-like protein n=1 Tax=Xylaria bambusicola TaxID=326684 RepID=UPI00200723C2|nr:phosphoglycerate mutase-like protein [Xylaria bambusicola]KAI0518395.1 phosphoglycerate mutase-like protein [Xylaria bambusicola]